MVRAQQQNVYNIDKSGITEKAYVLRPVRYSTMGSTEITDYCVSNSAIPRAYVQAAMTALGQCIKNFLLNGHSIVFPELGTFYLTSSGVSEKDAGKAGLNQLEKMNVRFLPTKELKTEVENLTLELDGVYDIAGETVLETDSEGTAIRTQKYYKRVILETSADDDDSGSSSNAGQSGDSSSSGTTATKYTVTLTASPSAGGTVSGAGQYTAGSTATIKATANSGYTFSGWSDGNTSASRTITVNAAQSLTANFTEDSDDDDTPPTNVDA